MVWTQALEIVPGVTAVIGGGGKTTLLRTLGGELAAAGHAVLLCTTTKIFPFPGIPCVTEGGEAALRAAVAESRLVCAGTALENGKLTAPELPVRELAALFEYVLVEADGAARRPMKAHAPHEPVIPPETGQTVCVAGASGFRRTIREGAHRPERYAALASAKETDRITPEMAAAVLRAEGLHRRLLVNQAELAPGAAMKLAELAGCPAIAGSLHNGKIF